MVKINGSSPSQPVVSICCATYNHAPYIRQCIDGFVMQKTNFPFEILIHDDASTDGTQDVIREYATKHPDLIKPIYQKENQYSKGVKVSLTYNYSRAKGKYVALCEGDDYWIDPYKLQKQVDFLESHPDYVMCSHQFDAFDETTKTLIKNSNPSFKGKTYDLGSLINGEWNHHPLTVMYRRDALDINHYSKYKMSMDIILFYEILKHGKGYCMPDVMAIYRRHNGGLWSLKSFDNKRLIEFNTRLAIYEVEKTDDAAKLLLSQFSKIMSRKWMLKHLGIFASVSKIFFKHFGLSFTLKLFFNKMLLNKNLKADSLHSVLFREIDSQL